ncbi:MAG: 1,4-dihydroxy-2-naphthoate octaprenyltransferase, partial [Flavobacteriales bacterium]
GAYGYHGLGDLAVFLFFGLIGVLGIQFLLGFPINHLAWSPAIFVGACSSAVLNANNLRDVENDQQKGKNTLVVLMGYKVGRWYQTILIFSGLVSGFICLGPFNHWITYVAMVPLLVLGVIIIQTLREEEPRSMDRFLKRIALSTFVFTLLLFIQHLI